MSLFAADYLCSQCNKVWDLLVYRERRDEQDCPDCQAPLKRLMGAPLVLKASFLDGTRRFAHLREQDRLDTALSEAAQKGDMKEGSKLITEKVKLATKLPPSA